MTQRLDLIQMTLEELERHIRERTAEANRFPADSRDREAIVKEIGRLRLYADAKRWIGSPGLKPGH